MSVSRRRPHDSNRGPQTNQANAAKSPALPPILFQLPNLNSQTSTVADNTAVEDSGSEMDDSPHNDDEVVFRDTSDFVPQPATSAEATLDEPEGSKPVAPVTSRLEKFTSRAMTFGLIALAVAWVVVVARNVNFSPNQVSQTDVPAADIESLDLLDQDLDLNIGNINSGQLAMNLPAPPTEVPMYEPAINTSMPAAPMLNVPSEMEPTIAMMPAESSATPIFPNISLETPRMTDEAGMPLSANDPMSANLPSDAELKAELDAAMASMQTPAQTASVSITPPTPSMAEESLESLAEMTPSLESAPREMAIQTSTPNRFDASKYAREVVHTPKKSTPTYSQTPLGVNDWSRYLPPMKTN